ncbi:hypothetical protein [Pararhodobacter zhoushanensis]|uniref:Uncharacterized protein n=1 Tax=Pararhodobacter zhoushanensis TaxID=2479545 RepID=A0ABT3H149_9RHOB|nr:hypothetical protein [Pararhodobacter zhoushanensis]MCW1933418.1 hypothetical protein [Pararhodobacter zhoushanensis]
MRPRIELSNWASAMIIAAAAVVLGVISYRRGPEPDAGTAITAMAFIFHAVILGALVMMALRFSSLVEGRGARKIVTFLALALGILSCLGLLARDFGII